MWRLRALVALVVVGVVAGGWWLYAQGTSGSSARALTGGDIAEIQQLDAQYNQAWDFRDVELYLSVYTDDAAFTTGAGEVYAGKKGTQGLSDKGLRRRHECGRHAQQHEHSHHRDRGGRQGARLLDRNERDGATAGCRGCRVRR